MKTIFIGTRVAAVLVLGAACGPDSDPLDTVPGTQSGAGSNSNGTESGEEPTGGVTEGSGTETGGVALTREVCDRYLECLAVTQPGQLPAAQMGFGAEGTCWEGPPEQIEQCITACYTGLEGMHEVSPDEPNCFQCEQDADCVTGERCVMGGCYLTYCGDGVVEHDEVCDDPNDVSCVDCGAHPNLACNPFSDAGCGPGEACHFDTFSDTAQCVSGELTKLGDGAICLPGSEGYCAPGLVCVYGIYVDGCAGDRCCTPLCNTQQPDVCPDGRVCGPADMSNYVGVCLSP